MTQRPPSATALALVALLASSSHFGCAPAPSFARKAQLVLYEGRFVELFDDAIEGSAVGLGIRTAASVRGDSVLRERAHVADGVVVVRVKTVTTKVEGGATAYVLQLEPYQRLGGKKPPSEVFDVRFDKSTLGYGIARSFEGRLVGKTFIAFVRQFANAKDDVAYHVHLAPSAPDVEAAVKEAVILDELH
jgi:hypothetical protein